MTTQIQSAEEAITHASYGKISGKRAANRSDPNLWLLELDAFCQLLPTGSVIDVGCGSSARDARLFRKRGYEYTGITYCAQEIQDAQDRLPEATFIVMDMKALDFPSHSFDGFWAVASLLHIPKRDIKAVLEGIKRITKVGGYGFIALKEGDGEILVQGSDPDDKRLYVYWEQEEFAAVLAECGFDVVTQTSCVKPHSPNDVWLEYYVKVSV